MLKKKLRSIGSALILLLFVHNAHSATLIDGFTDSQFLIGGVQSTDLAGSNVITDLGITDTLLGNARRILQAGSNSTEIDVVGGFLTVSTSSADTVGVYYTFNAIDLSAFAKAFSLNISFIDLNVLVQIIANGTSIFGFYDFGGIGQYLVDFSQFSDPSVFTHLNSLELKLTGPQAWDAEFSVLATVPEPSVIGLLLIGLLAAALNTRRKALTA